MMRTVALVLALAAPGLASVAHAQRPARSGFWAEIGGGPAHIRVGCTGCDDVTRRPGSGGYLRVGGAVSSRVMVGVESFTLVDRAFGFNDRDHSLVAENSTLAALVLWYPWGRGLMLKGGAGFASGEFTVEQADEDPIRTEGIGVGMTFGFGYDIAVWRSFSLSAGAATWVTATGDVVLPGLTVDDVIATMYSLSLGLTLR